MRPWLFKFDSTITTSVQSGPGWMHGPLLFITNVGQPIVFIAIALVFSAVALTENNVGLLVASGIVPAVVCLAAVMKMALQRARPATEYARNMLIHSFSFPSGHAAGAMIGAGFLAYIAWNSLDQPWAAIMAAVAVLIVAVIGVSRIYLGAHYPSDVVGGWFIGLLGLVAIIFFIRPTLSI